MSTLDQLIREWLAGDDRLDRCDDALAGRPCPEFCGCFQRPANDALRAVLDECVHIETTGTPLDCHTAACMRDGIAKALGITQEAKG